VRVNMAMHKKKKSPHNKKKHHSGMEIEIEIEKVPHKKNDEKHHAKKPAAKKKMKKVMKEFHEGKLHSGSKHGPEVTNPKQAVAIGYSKARKAKKKKKK